MPRSCEPLTSRCALSSSAGTELRVALPEVYATAPGETESATVVPVPFKKVEAAEHRTGMQAGNGCKLVRDVEK